MNLAKPLAPVVTSALILGCLSPALATPSDVEQAKQLSTQALRLAQKGDYSGALVLYEQAVKLDASGVRHCNVGAAHFQLDHWPQAHFFLGTCLDHASSLAADFVAQMSKAYAFSEKKLRNGSYGQIRFESETPGVLVSLPVLAKRVPFSLPRVLWLPVGKYAFHASLDNVQQQHTAVVNAKDISVTRVIFETRMKEIPKQVVLASTQDVPHIAKPLQKPGQTKRWLALGTGVAATGLGVVFHVSALGVVREIETKNGGGDQRLALTDELKQKRIVMAVGYGIGAIALGVGTYWWLSEESAPAPNLEISSTGATVGMDWSF